MPTEKLDFDFNVDSDLALSVSDLKSKYFLGIPIVDSEGNPMPDEDIAFYIRSAQEELETELDIKLKSQIITEDKDFIREQYNKWGYIKASYPVRCIHQIDGFVGTVRQVNYPKEWFTIHETNDEIVHRNINIVPTNDGSVVDQNVVYSGIYPQLGYYGARQIPQYWKITYTTGFDKIPSDLLRVIGMKASIPLFDQLGDLIIGAGIASQSIGLDGLSQSVSTTSSATNAGYGARITSYNKQLKELMPQLRKKYTGFVFGTM